MTAAASRRDFAWIGAAYGCALAAAAMTVLALPQLDRFWQAAAADCVATVVIFAFSRAFANSSFYDAYWSVAPPLLVGFWLWTYGAGFDARGSLALLLVCAWAVRLTHNWARGWTGLGHEDWRYGDLRQKTGRWFPVVDLLGIHLMPTVLVLLGCLPLALLAERAVAAAPVPLGSLDVLWLALGSAALWLETRADNVLRRFRRESRGGVLREDVWAWCRHPNYLGELGFWFALALAGYVATGALLAWLGAAAMLVLFLGVSIPMIDRRQLANKAAYADYVREVPTLLPRPPRS